MPVAMHFVFRAVTKESDCPFRGEVLEEAEGELLAMVLDVAIPLVDAAAFAQLLEVTPAILGPANCSGEEGIAQRFARAQVSHPDVVAILRQTTPASARGEDAEPVHAAFDRRMD